MLFAVYYFFAALVLYRVSKMMVWDSCDDEDTAYSKEKARR